MKRRSSTSLRQKGSIAGVDSSKGQDGDVPISDKGISKREKEKAACKQKWR